MYIQSEDVATQVLVVSLSDYAAFWRRYYQHLIESVEYRYPSVFARDLRVELTFKHHVIPRMLRMQAAGLLSHSHNDKEERNSHTSENLEFV